MTNGQACDHADFNRDGDVNADDIATFTAALAKQLNNTGPGYSVHSRNIAEYRFLYRGYWYDQHLGIYHVRHRAYDPRIQRWLQPDPAMFVDGLNRYAYCGNRPFSLHDPMGLFSVTEFVTDYLHNAGAGISELGDHLTGATRREDAAWAAMMQMQQSVDQQALNLAAAQLQGLRDQETRDIIDTAVSVIVVITIPFTGGGSLTIAGSMSQGMMIGMGADLMAQTSQMLMGVRSQWDYNRTATAGVWGGAFGAAGPVGTMIGRSFSKLPVTQIPKVMSHGRFELTRLQAKS